MFSLPFVSQFDELSFLVDIVVHNGAHVHWVLPYDKLKPSNVGGTVEALRLACRRKTKPFHFVSSTSVFDTEHYVNLDVSVVASVRAVMCVCLCLCVLCV